MPERPPQLIPLIGRQQELDEIVNLLASHECRLLTLVGSGGIGKTRLALEIIRLQDGNFANEIYFVPLQSLRSTEFLVPTIAESLEMTFNDNQSTDTQLIDFLRDKHLLLVLDNFEHLLSSADLLAAIVQDAPDVKIVVTSRERLNLREEWVYDVQGLLFPDSETSEDSTHYSAVQLFTERARQVGYVPDDADSAAIVHICRLVDGSPLGIELAASWVRTLTCQKIKAEIERSLDFLSTSTRNIPERHRSMRAVLEGSWDALDETVRTTYARLSVFSGGFTQEAAEAVAGASLLMLSQLMDASLLQVDDKGRFHIQEILLKFAQEKLNDQPDIKTLTQDRHCDYYARFLHEREETIYQILRSEILVEMDNVRAAWHYATQQHNITAIGQAMPCLSWIYLLQHWFEEGERSFQLAEDRLREMPSSDDTRLLLGMVLMCKASCQRDKPGKTEQMRANIEAGLALLEEQPAQKEMVLAIWHGVFGLLHLRSDPELILDWAGKHLEYARLFDDPFGEMAALGTFGNIMVNAFGDLQQAQQYIEEALTIARRSELKSGFHSILEGLGEIAYFRGLYSKAKTYFESAIEQKIAFGVGHHFHASLFKFGQIALDLGEDQTAKDSFEQCVAVATDLQSQQMIVAGLAGLGAVAVFQDDMDAAEVYFADSHARSHMLSRNRLRYFDELELGSLGYLALLLGHHDEAVTIYEMLISHYQDANLRLALNMCYSKIGHALLALGDEKRATRYLFDALDAAIRFDVSTVVLEALTGIAQLLIVPHEDAVALLTFAHQQPTANRITRVRAENFLHRIRADLPPAAFDSAVERGGHFSREAAIALVRQIVDRHDTPQQQANQQLIEPLTDRELDIIRRLAQGLNSHEIAEQLVLSVGTIRWYRKRIYEKLNAHSRSEAIARAKQLNLLS